MATKPATKPQEPKGTDLPNKPGKLPGAPPKFRRATRKRTSGTWDPEMAREMGKRGGRPKGGITKAYATVYELAKRVITDPLVQDTILLKAQLGLLDAATMRDLMYTYGGRPAYKMQVQAPDADPEDQMERDRMRAMPKDKRRVMMELLRELNAIEPARLALQGRVEATDAEIVQEPEPA